MARITVEDCLDHVENRFALIHLAANRVRHLRKGAEPLVVCKNKDVVLSLREIAAQKVYAVKKEENEDQIEMAEDQIPQELPEPPDTQEAPVKEEED